MEDKKNNINILENLLGATFIIAYFILIYVAYHQFQEQKLLLILKIFSTVILIISLFFMEYAFRKDNGKRAINALETLVLAAHNLSMAYIVELKKLNFEYYLIISGIMFFIYYIIKTMVVNTKEKKEYLNSLSDIKEIVANDPIKKEAKKSQK